MFSVSGYSFEGLRKRIAELALELGLEVGASDIRREGRGLASAAAREAGRGRVIAGPAPVRGSYRGDFEPMKSSASSEILVSTSWLNPGAAGSRPRSRAAVFASEAGVRRTTT